MRISIDHLTRYTYEAPVRYSTQYLRLTPASNAHQRVLEWKLEAPATPLELRDGYGNILHLLTIIKPVTEIVIRSGGVVETSGAIDGAVDGVTLSPLVYCRSTPLTRADGPLAEFAEHYRRPSVTLSTLQDLAGAVLEHLPFQPGVTVVHSTAAEAFEAGRGVCQDHAHVFIACCRQISVPARYVSGYLYLPDTDEPVASHAWAEAWVGDRWRSFDITNGCPASERHVRIAVGADYRDASPVRGMRRGGGEEHMVAQAIVSSE